MKTYIRAALPVALLLCLGTGFGITNPFETTHHKASTQALAAISLPDQSVSDGNDYRIYRTLSRTQATTTTVAPAPTTYTVAAGNTLGTIAASLHRSTAQMFWWNHLQDPNALMVGQVLKIPPASYAAPPLPAPPPPPAPVPQATHAVVAAASAPSSGVYSYGALESLWISVGGPSWAAPAAASVAECESGGEPWKYNDQGSGAAGLWQILGSVVPGNLLDPVVNAENAVKKFEASGDTWAQWVCKP